MLQADLLRPMCSQGLLRPQGMCTRMCSQGVLCSGCKRLLRPSRQGLLRTFNLLCSDALLPAPHRLRAQVLPQAVLEPLRLWQQSRMLCPSRRRLLCTGR